MCSLGEFRPFCRFASVSGVDLPISYSSDFFVSLLSFVEQKFHKSCLLTLKYLVKKTDIKISQIFICFTMRYAQSHNYKLFFLVLKVFIKCYLNE